MGGGGSKPKNEAAQLFFDRIKAQYDVGKDTKGLPKPDASFKALASALCAIPRDDEHAVISICKKPVNETIVAALTKAFVRNRAIEGLLFSKCEMKDNALAALFQLIFSNIRIAFFDLSQTSLSSEQLTSLCESLLANEFLQSVGMVGLGITDAEVEPVLNLLRKTRTLRAIDLSDNLFTAKTLETLVDIVAANATICRLTLRGYIIPAPLQRRLSDLLDRNTAVTQVLDEILDNSCKRNFSTRLSAFRRSVFLRRGEEEPQEGGVEDAAAPTYKLYRSSTVLNDKFVHIVSERFAVSFGESKGRRSEMQDVLFVQGRYRGEVDQDFFAVYDGHGGREPAAYCAKHLHLLIATEMEKIPAGGIPAAFKAAFAECNRRLSAFCSIQGTTATCLYISPEKTFYLGHVGDSRAVFATRSASAPSHAVKLSEDDTKAFQDAGVVQLTRDHNLKDEDERAAVAARGCTNFANNRVNGQLTLTRALGDSNLSSYLSCEPDVYEHALIQEDEFVILASDGIWDVVTPVRAVEFVREKLASAPLDGIAQQLVDLAFESNSMDNLSAIIVFLRAPSSTKRAEPAEPAEAGSAAAATVDATADPATPTTPTTPTPKTPSRHSVGFL
ncbi:hypothetical protein CAOG_07299 [Capsaspora owczarzaki ATCC 30864]|uniref:hypothetical protein n=1 Tax=Capsaspora owczarzaki (strain ATCC 30864) TaxID=595528 RepID=UPI0001FE3CFB|nr:hypothetical protein CAOG_07299 [Capsaspora owczarzaki ATCC 30864]|eukprot:XP_004343158.1 hypothetical protein CAOG_07299 [Capsaspora owczarzaki ATCC 30864]